MVVVVVVVAVQSPGNGVEEMSEGSSDVSFLGKRCTPSPSLRL